VAFVNLQSLYYSLPSRNQIISQNVCYSHISGLFHELNLGWPFTKGTTENIGRYCKILCDKLKRAIQSTCWGIFSKCVDNACPNPGIESVGIHRQRAHFDLMEHLLYSPDQAPLDYHFFGSLTDAWKGYQFTSVQEVKALVHSYFYMATWLPIKKNYLRALRSLFIIGRYVLKSSETIWKNDVLAALLLSNCWFFLTYKHILLISVSLTEKWSWVHSILPSNIGYNRQLLWCSSGIPGNCHNGLCPHPILFNIQYSSHY
jgi:hypothetical protein